MSRPALHLVPPPEPLLPMDPRPSLIDWDERRREESAGLALVALTLSVLAVGSVSVLLWMHLLAGAL